MFYDSALRQRTNIYKNFIKLDRDYRVHPNVSKSFNIQSIGNKKNNINEIEPSNILELECDY